MCTNTHLDKSTKKIVEKGSIKKKVTWKGISSDKFNEISEETARRLKHVEDDGT